MCKRLWTDDVVDYDGEFFRFDGVVFEPKPVQRPWPPILVGGESPAALRRAARHGDGWIGITHTFESVVEPIARLRALLADLGRDPDGFQIVLGGAHDSVDDVRRWEDLGVTRLIVAPWRRSREAIEGMRRFADLMGLGT